MKKRFGQRIVEQHGLICNVLTALNFTDQIKLASLNSRTYDVTVPWNAPRVAFPANIPNTFPKIEAVTRDTVCKRTEATIEGEKGQFFG